MGNELKRGKLLKRAGLVILMGACAMLLSASQAKALVIDHFDDGVFAISVPDAPGSADSGEVVAATVVGGFRKVHLIWSTPPSDPGESARANVQANSSRLIWNEDDSIAGTLDVLYDGGGTGISPLVDLDADGSTGFAVGTDMGDGALYHVTITITDSGGNTSSVSGSDINHNTLNVLFLPFSSLSGTADINTVKSIDFLFDSNGAHGVDDGGDYHIHFLETTVPEPLTMLGMVFGLGSVGAYIRKRRMA
jgi:hypothetical protein